MPVKPHPDDSDAADLGALIEEITLDNHPFLRCMHGYGLCLWRLARFDEAGRVFDRMLWLTPSDNQGVRFLIGPVAAAEPWEEERWT